MTDNLSRAVLSKFTQGRNASAFKNNLEPGSYPVDLTVTLLGTLNKDQDSSHQRRDSSGSKHIVRYLVDKLSTQQFDELLSNLDTIRKGTMPNTWNSRTARRMDQIMPYKTINRSGNTTFTGDVIIEDCHTDRFRRPRCSAGIQIFNLAK